MSGGARRDSSRRAEASPRSLRNRRGRRAQTTRRLTRSTADHAEHLVSDADVEQSVDERRCPAVKEDEHSGQLAHRVQADIRRRFVLTVVLDDHRIDDDVGQMPRTATDDEQSEDDEQHLDDPTMMTS